MSILYCSHWQANLVDIELVVVPCDQALLQSFTCFLKVWTGIDLSSGSSLMNNKPGAVRITYTNRLNTHEIHIPDFNKQT